MRYKETYTLPFKHKIPAYIEDYLPYAKKLNRKVKFLKRYFLLWLFNQINLERNSINPNERKIIWINFSAPSLGDSLMDLSSRILLMGYSVDLITDKKNISLYNNDPIFDNVFSHPSQLTNKSYSLVILDSYSSRSISTKLKIAKNTKFVSMFGFFNGPDINRVLYSFFRMNQLLEERYSSEEIISIAKPSMSLPDINIELPEKYIAISVGGEWPYRTYENWAEIIDFINDKYNSFDIVIVGSGNGVTYAEEIQDSYPLVKNYVGQFSFKETATIISRASIFICCDGGLMHAGNCSEIIIVPLLARIKPEMRLTNLKKSFAIYDSLSVNNIPPKEVKKKIDKAINFYCKYHQT